MPITANEPLSLLQRSAEALEYASLLTLAASAPHETGERLLHVTAFAISALSGSRVKERAARKPFNPMLGETFELVREDLAGGFRFLAEKISHRPVRVASQADAKEWTYTHAPAPSQKFWGKSAELLTEGLVRVAFRGDKATDRYTWTPAVCFLRGVLAGERYVEPVDSMTVLDEGSGWRSVVTFKAGGMFSGRSEEVAVAVLDDRGEVMPLSMRGRWTSHLDIVDGPETRRVWTAENSMADAGARYGMTTFAAQMNEVTSLEEGMLPCTDSRLRPDQRAYEEGRVEEAESLKLRLEEGQRRRRKLAEEGGEEWTPRWFARMEGSTSPEEAWCAKVKGGYWSVRESRNWADVKDVFEM